MKELNLDTRRVLDLFERALGAGCTVLHLSEPACEQLIEMLAPAVERCYAPENLIAAQAAELSMQEREVLASLLPDPGSTMAGDFGEILAFVYLGSAEHPAEPIGPKKWQLKQDRTKPAPKCDVIHFIMPDWPKASNEDRLICAEVKTKSRPRKSSAIAEAMEDSKKDETSRLAKTLAWLEQRAIRGDLRGATTLAHVSRFFHATEHPVATRTFRAVVVIDADLLDSELSAMPAGRETAERLIVIAMPNLKSQYETLFATATTHLA